MTRVLLRDVEDGPRRNESCWQSEMLLNLAHLAQELRRRPHAHFRRLVAATFVVLASGCGGKSEHTGDSSDAQRPVLACPGTVVLDAGQQPCLIGQTCGNGRCVDPRGPISWGCPGESLPGCSGDADCDAGVCIPSSAICSPSMICAPPCTSSSCAADEQCGSDGRCAPRSCENGYSCEAGWLCAPARPEVPGQAYERSNAHGCSPASCVDDGFACPSGTQCNPSSGGDLHGCNPLRCDQGGTCAEDTRCDPANSRSADGCVPLPCAQDSDCDCGACLMGICAYQPGICVPQLL
jgi:hypothetical protein